MLQTHSFGKTLRMTADGDIYMGPNLKMSMIEDTEKVRQDINMVLHTVVGSWPFDINFGFDLPSIVEGRYNPTLITGKLTTALKGIKHIKEVKDIVIVNVNRTTRQITMYVEVILTNNETITTTGAVSI